ncbi:hypothetical protein BCR37DRAFT_380908 [Protomyces lactucae-debilis]|uniref:Uncharacterized protein n=1 Tax=Protomyces lactucae-debilis TaxID=2754530 RepID=A0A1Y2FC68_PROLT|nr:uncharacterized protein BCR37DRAFT_380908 [Protomyces lactucae-debilis]ORY81014.1 hypothetical protein BCR37DRAFT_380908 [Protomyces lactucae-debilis]
MEAEQLKALGDQHYKADNFNEAIIAYEKASLLASEAQAPTYLSDLSAAYYELGDYEHALEAIDRAFEQLHVITPTESSVSALDLKLRLRECRCLLQMQEFDQLLDAIQEVAQTVYDEHVEFGVIEDAALHSLDQLSVWGSSKANKFVTSLPRKRPQAKAKRKCRQAMSYDKVGATSFLSTPGTDEIIDPNCHLRIDELKWSHLSFFGGNVDMRHVIATMIDVYDQNPKAGFSLKMLLMDEDPCVVARSTILFFLIDELSRHDLDNPTTSSVELMTLMHYTYVGAMMPLWVHERLLSTIRVISTKLCSGQGIPAWLDFSLETIDQIMPVFKYWTGAAVDQVSIEQCMSMQKSAAGPMDEHPQSAAGKQQAADLRISARNDLQMVIGNFSADQLDHILHKSCPNLAKMTLKGKRETALKLFANDEALDALNRKRWVPDGLLIEHSTFYQGGLKMLYMPAQVHHREPKLAEHVKQLWNGWANFSSGGKRISKNEPQLAPLEAAIEYIKRHWKTNVTLLPLASDEADLSFDPFAIMHFATSREPPLAKPLWLYDYTSHWFTRAAKSVKKHGFVLYLEWRIGDSHIALEQILRSEEGRFDLFDRIYLCEEADQHGGLLAQVFDSFPNLNIGNHAFLACRLPETKASEYERILLDGTALPDLATLQEHLGITMHGSTPLASRFCNEYARWRPLAGLNTANRLGDRSGLKREALTDWLYQVFLTLALPRKRPAKSKAPLPTEPLNLHAFFRLLLYLQSVGIPGHWLGQVIDNLIQHRVVTRARPLPAWQETSSASATPAVQGATPSGCVSSTTAAKPFCVMPFALEMEAALCIWFPLLTFGVTCVDFPDANGIRLYTVKFGPPPQTTANSASDADDQAPLSLWFSQTNKRSLGIDLSRDLVGSHAAAPGIRLVSSFNWDPIERQASFLCWGLSMDYLVTHGWYLRLVKTGLWETASAVVSVKMCKAGIALSEYQEPL